MSDELTITDVAAGAPAADSAALAPSPGSDLGVIQAGTELGQAAAVDAWESGLPEVDQIISSIPADDSDLQGQLEQRHAQSVIQTRGQLRVLNKALRQSFESQKAYRELGDLSALKPQIELANRLFSPVLDPATNKPVYDPATRTAYVTTKPFIEYLDENSPGMPEQLLADLLEFQTEVSPGVTDTLANQVFRHWGLDPRRLQEYRNIDTLPTVINSAVSQDELKDIPAEYHEAYKTIPPSIRAAWETYEEGDQARMLQDYKGKLDDQAYKQQVRERDKRLEAAEQAQFQELLGTEQLKYFDTVRRERFGAIANSLNNQVTFSEDAATNTIMHGVVGATLANLIDPELRFVSEGTLKALGIQLDHTFDEALNQFNSNATDKVAYELSGQTVLAGRAQEKAKAGADLVVAKLSTIAVKLAEKLGGKMKDAAAFQGKALGTATTVRPTAGYGAAPNEIAGILPAGVMPGSPEARAFWAANFPGLG